MSSFASCWRYNNVIPLPKSESPSLIPSEYHPISIIPVFSKVFEYLLSKHLDAYVETNDLFPSLQFVFGKGLGTCNALLTVTSAVQKFLETGCEVHIIGLDFSAATGRVSHEASTFKLKQMGINGNFLNKTIAFLTEIK